MEAVSAVLWTFSSLVDGCVAAVCLFLRINELLGSVTLAALYYATVVVQYLGAGLCQAYRELVFFMQDIVSLVHFIVSVTDILVHGSADCIVMTVTSLSRLSTFLKESFVSGCNGASSAALQVVSSSRNFLGLFFRSALLLLQLLPYTTLQLARYVYYGVFGLVSCICTFVATVTDYVRSVIVTATSDLYQFIFGQPGDVYTGLVILLLTAITLRVAIRAEVHRFIWHAMWRLVFTLRARALQRRRQVGQRESPSPPPFTMTLRRTTAARTTRLKRLELELEQQREKQLCVVCLNEERTVILMPCRHFALCNRCVGTLLQQQQQTCPMCRHIIFEVISVYA